MHGTFKVKADPYSLDSLIGWLETRHPEQSYDFSNCSGACLLDQYATAAGLDCDSEIVWKKMYDLFDNLAVSHPRTFGAALERARVMK